MSTSLPLKVKNLVPGDNLAFGPRISATAGYIDSGMTLDILNRVFANLSGRTDSSSGNAIGAAPSDEM